MTIQLLEWKVNLREYNVTSHNINGKIKAADSSRGFEIKIQLSYATVTQTNSSQNNCEVKLRIVGLYHNLVLHIPCFLGLFMPC